MVIVAPQHQEGVRRFVARGAVRRLLKSRAPEILLEGPAGTGKSHGLLQKAHLLAMTIAGVRILFLRKTRKSLSDSVLVEFEQSVLPPGHPAKHGTATRGNRSSYLYPNGSEIVCGGLDNADRFLSAQFDLICVFEAHEATLDDWQVLSSRARNGMFLPGGQMVADTNPRESGHWLNKRASRGLMERLQSRHWHNPRYFDWATQTWTKLGRAYLQRLNTLSGPRRAWLLEGRWDTAEGPVFPEYDPAVHVIHRKQAPLDDAGWYFASVDFGRAAPGVMQVWAVVGDQELYRVAEIYRTQMQLDWWASRAVEFHERFDLQAIVCDPSRDDVIEHFNDRLGWARTSIRGEPEFLAFGANNSKTTARGAQDLGGLDCVRHYMRDEVSGRSRLFLVSDAMEYGPDPDRDFTGKAVRLEDELESYVNEKNEEGKPILDQPAKGLDDHAIDAMRYAVNFHYAYNLGPEDVRPEPARGTMARIAHHAEVMSTWE